MSDVYLWQLRLSPAAGEWFVLSERRTAHVLDIQVQQKPVTHLLTDRLFFFYWDTFNSEMLCWDFLQVIIEMSHTLL